MGSTQSLIRKAEGLLQRHPDTRTGTALAQWCTDVASWTQALSDGRLRERMVDGMNRTIRLIRECVEYDALVGMLSEAFDLVIARASPDRPVSWLYHVASIPFALPGIRMSLREEKECLDKQFASRLGLWNEHMLFDEIDHELDDSLGLSPYMDSPLVGHESRFYFRSLRHDADPFAEYIVWLFEVALEGSRCVLYRRCNGIRDGAERTGLQRELSRLLGAEEEDHGSVEWRGSIGRLRHDLLEGADASVAGAWTWLGLNQLACASCGLPGFEAGEEHERELRRRLSGPELWLPFAPNVEGALRRVTQEMKDGVETVPVDDAQQARKQRCDRSKAAEFWKDWKLTWLDDQPKFQKDKSTVPTENLTAEQKKILKGLFALHASAGVFDRRRLTDIRLGADPDRELDSKCRQSSRTAITRLNQALRERVRRKGFPDPPNPILSISRGAWRVYFTIDYDSMTASYQRL